MGARALTAIAIAAVLAVAQAGCSDAQVPSYRGAADTEVAHAQTAAERAVVAAQAAVAARPQDAEAWEALASAYLEAGEQEAAWRAITVACHYAPKDAGCQDQAGAVALRGGHPQRAAAAFARATEANPADWVAWDGLAAAFVARGAWTRAEAAVTEALVVGGPQPESFWLAGTVAYGEHRWAVARAYFANALAADPHWWAPWWGLAEVDAKTGDLGSAAKEVATALALNPTAGSAWFLAQALRAEAPQTADGNGG
ncbi:MAG: tetratricopeptide repeat protein [Firmicutes bacterium]|nr:tetratricopeptide repeat protein [Alicyclobacillaceae bacterium]MCL6496796.1 tetratricopeptide repeat protein [Bacillota bacterium]